MTRKEPKTQMLTIRVVAFLRLQPRASSKKARLGWYIEIELVMAARKSMKNQTAPMRLPNGMCAKTTGRVVKPRPKLPPCTAAMVPERPRKMKDAVRVMSPPKPTSNSSLVAEAVRPESTTSERRRMYEA